MTSPNQNLHNKTLPHFAMIMANLVIKMTMILYQPGCAFYWRNCPNRVRIVWVGLVSTRWALCGELARLSVLCVGNCVCFVWEQSSRPGCTLCGGPFLVGSDNQETIKINSLTQKFNLVDRSIPLTSSNNLQLKIDFPHTFHSHSNVSLSLPTCSNCLPPKKHSPSQFTTTAFNNKDRKDCLPRLPG